MGQQNHVLLHLCFDSNFLDKSSKVFEHFYPGKNIFCVISFKRRKTRMVKMQEAIWMEQGHPDIDLIKNLCSIHHVDTILLHGAYPDFITILKAINFPQKYPVYWLFFGYELYYALGEKTDYPLIDNTSVFFYVNWVRPTKYNAWLRRLTNYQPYYSLLQDTLKFADYFCFWLYDDYLLLKKFFDTDIQFRHFQYSACYKTDVLKDSPICYEKSQKEIRVNHSASKTGNHDTLIHLLNRIDKNNEFRKVFPLAYGNGIVKSQVIRMGRRYFGDQFCPITERVSKDEYLESLSKTGVAIFGHNRQEAGGNVFPLLKSGSKVFLRNLNPLLSFYKKRGYYIYSVEDDLNSVDDLQPLTREQMEHNVQIGRNRRTYYEDFMQNLIDR